MTTPVPPASFAGELCGWCNVNPADFVVEGSQGDEIDVTCSPCAPNFMRRFLDAAGNLMQIPTPLTAPATQGPSAGPA